MNTAKPCVRIHFGRFSTTNKGLIFLSDEKNLSISVYDNGSIGQPVPLNAPVSDYISWNAAVFSGNHAVALYSGDTLSSEPSDSMQCVFAVSNDAGASWYSVPLSPALSSDMSNVYNGPPAGMDLSFADKNNGFLLVPGYSNLLVTKDGGRSWYWQ